MNHPRRGFSLVEILMSMSVMLVLGSIAAVGMFSDIGRTDSGQDLPITLSALREARAFSQNGAGDGVSHGVRVNSHAVTVFDGMTFADRDPKNDIQYPFNGSEVISTSSDIAFQSVWGATATDTAITFGNYPQSSFSITVSHDGTIDSL